jgi:hypothetical protein
MMEEQARALRNLASTRTEEIGIEERRRWAIAAAGRFHSGVSDISTKHDEYLVFEAYASEFGGLNESP